MSTILACVDGGLVCVPVLSIWGVSALAILGCNWIKLRFFKRKADDVFIHNIH